MAGLPADATAATAAIVPTTAPQSARAQSADHPTATTPILTLDQCIALARENSLDLRIAENALSSANLSRRALGAARLPQIKLGGNASASPTFDRFGYDPVITDYGQIAGQIIAEQTLYDGGAYRLKTKQAQLDIESLTLARRIAERDLVYTVKQIFIEILRAKEEIGLRRQSLSRLADYLNLVKNLYGGAQASYTDVLKTEIQLSSANAALLSTTEALALGKYELSEMIGAEPDTAFDVRGALDSLIAARTNAIPPGTDTAAAGLVKSLESKSNDLAVARSDIDIAITHREKYPTVSLLADAGLLTSLENPDLEERMNHVGYSAGIILELPLVDWGQRSLREREQRLAAQDARYRARAYERSLAREVRSLTLQIETLERGLSDLRTRAKRAEENFVLTKSKYVGGAAPATEVLEAQQLITDTRLEELQARADILKLTARIEQILAR
jgi:outer membrane protein